jgi:hypothetical protein
MSGNYQQMGAAGQQMMLQQQRQQQGQQQRPPNQNNAPNGQVQRMIFEALQNTAQNVSGWQSAVLIQERISLIWNMSVSPLAPMRFIKMSWYSYRTFTDST